MASYSSVDVNCDEEDNRNKDMDHAIISLWDVNVRDNYEILMTLKFNCH
jgi:hypothetical protein